MVAVSTAVREAMESWLRREPEVVSAVLFGSFARTADEAAAADRWSDVDFHLIVKSPEKLERLDWRREVPNLDLCIQVARPAGAVRKLTLIFGQGEADLVLVPAARMRLLRWMLRLGLGAWARRKNPALDSFATIISGGYRFVKGEKSWGRVYAALSAMPGFRLDDGEVRRMADSFLCDLLWVFQKLDRGEFVAAQRVLHRSLMETNVVLMHEYRMRRREPTFQQARRVELLLRPEELDTMAVSARLDGGELRAAAWRQFGGLHFIMRELVPPWSVPAGMMTLLSPYRIL